MGAPLTVEQMILNHNIGVNISDAATFKGHQITEFSLIGHKHSASDITTGVMSQDRLPVATSSAKGIVQLSSNTDSTDNTIAATSSAVNAVKLLLAGKSDVGHKHNPQDIQTGTFTSRLTAFSELATGAGIIRNIFVSNSSPSSSVGNDGDIYFQYE